MLLHMKLEYPVSGFTCTATLHPTVVTHLALLDNETLPLSLKQQIEAVVAYATASQSILLCPCAAHEALRGTKDNVMRKILSSCQETCIGNSSLKDQSGAQCTIDLIDYAIQRLDLPLRVYSKAHAAPVACTLVHERGFKAYCATPDMVTKGDKNGKSEVGMVGEVQSSPYSQMVCCFGTPGRCQYAIYGRFDDVPRGIS